MVAPKLPPDVVDPALYAQLEALPEHLNGEIIAGQVIASPRPAGPHTLATSVIGPASAAPSSAAEAGRAAGGFSSSPSCASAPMCSSRSWAAGGRSACRSCPAGRLSRSPRTGCWRFSRPRRAGWTASARCRVTPPRAVKHVWLVDPLQQTLEVYRLEGLHLALVQGFQGATVARAEPFDAIELNLADLWLPAEA